MKKIKFLSLGLAFTLVCSALPAQELLAAGQTEPAAESAEDTEEAVEAEKKVLEIRTAEEFLDFAEHCYLDGWSRNMEVCLKEDIDLSAEEFPMIPVFAGTFDGEGHTITGFHNDSDEYLAGLFRYIEEGGIVKNLNLKGNVSGTEGETCLGGICGVNYGTIRNCTFQGIVSGRNKVGGIAGINENTGVINGCYVKGRINGYYMTGGIAGANYGVITSCKNYARINNDSEWVEEDDEIGVGIFFSVNVSEDDAELYSGVDTGGIVGYSSGMVSRCTNYGGVGYEHTGYNIGGIAGRQAGVVSFCSNTGVVYGRKDVGGIVGQMEPYLEADEKESLRNAINKLHDLINKTIDDMQAEKDVVKVDFDRLTAYSEKALDSGNAMIDQMSDFLEHNVNQVRILGERMDYISDSLPEILNHVTAAGDSLGQFNDAVKKAVESLGTVSGSDAQGEGALSESMDRLQETSDRVNQAVDTIREITENPDGSLKTWDEIDRAGQEKLIEEMLQLSGSTADLSNAASDVLDKAEGLFDPKTQDSLNEAADHLKDLSDSLKNASNGARDVINYINAQEDLNFTGLGEDFSEDRENLHVQLVGISNSLQSLSDNASSYTDLVNEDLKAVNNQLNIVFNLLVDHLSDYGELSVEEMYEEVSDEEIDSITTGRTDSCTNAGVVKGDINIGGIAGSMSIDEEDPEDNAAGSVNYEIGRHFITKCIIVNCVNDGYITAKKDGAGGVVGYMAHGIVVDSEGYGEVESTEGSYVGGICGESLTVIKRCYALCSVAGAKNVGGIAGYAETLKDCCAIVTVESTGGSEGAIAGQLASYDNMREIDGEEPAVCRNYYVGDEVHGIDDISYLGIAEPVTYEQLLQREGLPNPFRHLRVIYRLEDSILGTEEVAYGESLANLQYPLIPAREGCYGVWPDYSDEVMKGNLVIEGEYKDNVTVVESDERYAEDAAGEYDRPLALVEQVFTEDTVLKVSVGGMEPPAEAAGKEQVVYHLALENGKVSTKDTFAVRILNPYEDAEVWGYQNGVWSKLEARQRGQYLQVDMSGEEAYFCIAKKGLSPLWIAAAAAVVAAAVLLLIGYRKFKKRKKPVKK